MKSDVATPAALSRLRVLCYVMLAVFALTLVQILEDLFLLVLTTSGGHAAAMGYALTLTELAGVLSAGSIALRFVRTAKLPGTVALLGLLALGWAVALIGHYS